MAETSGFFQAIWDDSLTDPTTGQDTGWWDKTYIADEFSKYFALFVGNGVFGSPTNQLKVSPGTGLNVVVSAGWAFINGCWYHNDTAKTLAVSANTSGTQRVDSVKVRLDESNRRITVDIYTGDTSVTRGSSIYDLKLANIIVPTNSTVVSGGNITDTRTDESVCGLVKGLMEIETTADLFAQYQAQFEEWFDDIKDQLTGDLAARLQLEFDELNGKVDDYNENYQEVLEATQAAAEQAESVIEDYVDKDYVIAEQTFTFTNKVCVINDAKVTANSLIDVYFTTATIDKAEEAQIDVESGAGTITLTAKFTPTGTIRGAIRVRVR